MRIQLKTGIAVDAWWQWVTAVALLSCVQACSPDQTCDPRSGIGGLLCAAADTQAASPAEPTATEPTSFPPVTQAVPPAPDADASVESTPAPAADAGDTSEPPTSETEPPASSVAAPPDGIVPEPDPALAACVADVYADLSDGCKTCLCGVSAECRANVAQSACDAACWDLLRCIDANCPNFQQTSDTSCVLMHCAGSLGGARGAMSAASCANDCADACR